MAENTLPSSSRASSSLDNTLKVLVATDCHLGYQETDPNIGADSFVTFEEILILAVENEVDMILLGGDLFHHNNPSQQTLNRCMALFRQYTMGSRPVYMQLLGNDSIVLPEGGAPVNYMDENLNISIPVFSIHGNHDDPSGVGLCSTMDTLASAGLINYFGKWTDLSKIEVRPILIKKGTTLLALYGLSHIKDDRLSRLFLEEKVTMARPKETPEEWFNLFVLHQNRVDRGPKRHVSENFLPGFLDLVIWGHEHDCDIEVQKTDRGFYITQPGSSVPTSLSEGETKPKHVGLLEICNKKFKLKPLKLKTTRPFLFDSLRLMDIPVSSSVRGIKSEEIRAACQQRVEEMIFDSKSLLTGHTNQPTLPLIRLRCEFDDDSQLFNLVRFGQLFYGRVANPDVEIIKLKKAVGHRSKKDHADAQADIDKLREMNEEAPETFSSCVEQFVEEYFTTYADKALLILSTKGMATGVERFIDKGDASAIDSVCQYQRKMTLKKMMQLDITEENATEHLLRLRDERLATQENDAGVRDALDANAAYSRSTTTDSREEVLLDDDDDFPSEEPEPVRPRKPVTVPAMFSKTRGKANGNASLYNDDFEVEEVDDFPVPARGRGRGRGRGSRGATTSRARGGRGSRSRPAVQQPPTPTRGTPARQAAVQSQLLMSSISMNYEDDSD